MDDDLECDRFIYDNTTGALFFDVDGTGVNLLVEDTNLMTQPSISELAIALVFCCQK